MTAAQFITILLAGALTLSVPVIIAGIGEIFLERTGGFNVGIEGIMLIGAVTGVIGSAAGGFWLGLVAGIAAGALVGVAMGLAATWGKADFVILGIAVGLFGIGLSTFLFQLLAPTGQSNLTVATQPKLRLSVLEGIPILGPVLSDAGLLFYLAVALSIAAWWVLANTRFGLRSRAVGDDAEAAAARGISPIHYRFVATVIAGAFAGLAGATVPLSEVGSFSPHMTGGAGFIALAVVIIARRQPLGLFAGALLFAFFNSLALLAQTRNLGLPVELYQALPYLVTIVVLCITAAIGSRTKRKHAISPSHPALERTVRV